MGRINGKQKVSEEKIGEKILERENKEKKQIQKQNTDRKERKNKEKKSKRKKTMEKKLKEMKMYFVNCRGLKSKLESLKEITTEYKPDIVGLVETHLDSEDDIVLNWKGTS